MYDQTFASIGSFCIQDNSYTNLQADSLFTSLCGVQVCRTTLLSAALKTLGANKDVPLPIKLFEVGYDFSLRS